MDVLKEVKSFIMSTHPEKSCCLQRLNHHASRYLEQLMHHMYVDSLPSILEYIYSHIYDAVTS